MPKLEGINIQKLVNDHCAEGRMGWVKFRKVDGTIRKMTFIKVCDKHTKGPRIPNPNPNPSRVTVYDIQAKGIRCFKVARVLSLSVGGQKYIR